MEITMFNHFIAGQRIRARISDRTSQTGDVPQKLREVFIKVFQNDSRGTFLNDLWSFDDDNQYKISKSASKHLLVIDIYKLLEQRLSGSQLKGTIHPRPVFVLPNFVRRGVTFSTYIDSPGNSNVIFGEKSRWFAGRITAIFLWPTTLADDANRIPCCVVEPLQPLTDVDALNDPYRIFPEMLSGKLFYSIFGSPTVILAEDIICHFASTRFRSAESNVSITHVLPLDRVRGATSEVYFIDL